MGVLEILIIIGCALLVLGVIIGAIVRKKQGKHSCGYYCDGNCSHCSFEAQHKKPKQN